MKHAIVVKHYANRYYVEAYAASELAARPFNIAEGRGRQHDILKAVVGLQKRTKKVGP